MPTNDVVARMGSHQSRTTRASQIASQRHVAEHSRRVMQYACLLAETLRLSDAMVEEIRVASLLHDIGKHALPVALLDKTAPLAPEEWSLIKQHAELGSALAGRLGHNADIRALIRHHHEHWDGSGYPCGLAGADTPLGARVIAIADVFDALTSPRSYRVALSDLAALQVMRAEAGTVLDPNLFDVFQDLLERTSSERTRIALTIKKRPVRFAHYVAVH